MKATVTNISKRIDVKDGKQDGTVNYDVDNAYPQRVTDIINSSGTATLCVNIMSKFIQGDGFNDVAFEETKINKKGVTAKKLIRKIAKSISRHDGFCLHFNYNALYEITTISYIPFKDVRFTTSDHKTHPNKLQLYDDWEKIKKSKIDEKDIEYFDFYNPDPKTIQEQVEEAGGWENYNGQILYWTTEGVEYVLSPADAVLEDMQTDAHAKTFKFRNITTNFLSSYILEVEEFEDEEQRDEFINSLADFQGADDALKMLILEKKVNQESGFELKKVDIQDVEKLYEFTEMSVRDNIIRQFLIPHVLLVATEGKLGTTQEIVEAVAFYNGVTLEYRNAVSDILKDLFERSIYKGITDDYSIVEVTPKVADVRDTNEGKNAIIGLLSNAAFTPEQKINILSMLYGYSKEDAVLLVAQKDMIVQ